MPEAATAQQPASTMTEAGFSMNVKMLDGSGQEVMLTFRAPFANQTDKLIEHYNATIGKLLAAGWQPIGAKPSQNAAQPAASGTPNCPTHGTAMRPGKRGGFFCPKKVGDDYCNERVR